MPVDVDALIRNAPGGKQLPNGDGGDSAITLSSFEDGAVNSLFEGMDRRSSGDGERQEEDSYEWSEGDEFVKAVERAPLEEKYLRSRAGQLTVLRRPRRRTVHVACSVKSGLGTSNPFSPTTRHVSTHTHIHTHNYLLLLFFIIMSTA